MKNLKILYVAVFTIGTLSAEKVSQDNKRSAYQNYLKIRELQSKQMPLYQKQIPLVQEGRKAFLELQKVVVDCEANGNCEKIDNIIASLFYQVINCNLEDLEIRKQLRNSQESREQQEIFEEYRNFKSKVHEPNGKEPAFVHRNQSAYQDYKQCKEIRNTFPLICDSRAIAIGNKHDAIHKEFHEIKRLCEAAGNCETSKDFERLFSEVANLHLLHIDAEKEFLNLHNMKPIQEINAKYRNRN